MPSKIEDYKSKSSEEILKKLGSNQSTGLSAGEAKQGLQKYRLNEISEKKPTPFLKLMSLHSLDIEVDVISFAVINYWKDFFYNS